MMNNSSWLGQGNISLICGCMFAGKTEELIRRISVLERAKKKVIVFKPKIDNRYGGEKEIVSHNNRRITANLVENGPEMAKILEQNAGVDAVAIDEVHFFGKDVLPIVKKLSQNKKIVICAGLDRDYWNQYDSLMSRLLVEADIVDKLFAICSKCNNIANRTQRMKDGKPISFYHPRVMVGGSENYEARCKFCYIYFPE